MENSLRSSSDYGSWNSKHGSSWETSCSLQPSPVGSPISKGIEAFREEFKMNGADSPYDPEVDEVFINPSSLQGMGPASRFLRQTSCPERGRPPARLPALPRPAPTTNLYNQTLPRPAPSTNLYNQTLPDPIPTVPHPRADTLLTTSCAEVGSVQMGPRSTLDKWPTSRDQVSEEHLWILRSLPKGVLYPLLRDLERVYAVFKDQECGFCKNNRESENVYKSHSLRTNGRLTCPVLRSFQCPQCGARGDHAHTLKYCPLTSPEERFKSTAMMRTLRAAGRRRRPASAELPDYVRFGETTPSVVADGYDFNRNLTRLDPSWAALEQKLKRQ